MSRIKLSELLNEIKPKKTWVKPDKQKYADNLIDIVQTAYKNAPLGSFIKSSRDVAESDWQAIDIDDNPDIDATIFYRGPRSGETWGGFKIQGIGHDGDREAINAVLNRLKLLLNQNGYWVEASDALEHVLYKLGVPYISDESVASKIFPKSDLKMIGDRGKYNRKVSGKTVTETIFGKPKVR
jgi:hypothetical protein